MMLEDGRIMCAKCAAHVTAISLSARQIKNSDVPGHTAPIDASIIIVIKTPS